MPEDIVERLNAAADDANQLVRWVVDLAAKKSVDVEAITGHAAEDLRSRAAYEHSPTIREAAAEITRLRSALKEREEALQEIADRPGCGMDYAKGVGSWPIDEAENMARIARASLNREKDA